MQEKPKKGDLISTKKKKNSKEKLTKTNLKQINTSKEKYSNAERSKRSQIPFRLNFLFFIIFGLFVALIVQLAYLQIANSALFETRIEWSQKSLISGSAPRGGIYDAQGTALVANKSNQAIIYTKIGSVTPEEQLKIANELNQLIDVETGELTDYDKKDYFLATPENLETVETRLSEEEKNLSGSDLYKAEIDKVTSDEINYDEKTLKAVSIYKKINSVQTNASVFVKNQNVSDEEIARVGEHTGDLLGISTGLDWQREYPQDDLLKSILGTVSSEQAGLPADEVEAYLTKGYARNDRVGTSYLEKQYESVLRGTKSQSEILMNKNSKEIGNQTTLYTGDKGKNLQLSIDIEYQKQVQEILERNYQDLINSGKAAYSDGAYAVVTDPKTGDVLAMAGLNHDLQTNEISDNTLGNLTNAYLPGSIIKGATISAGFEQNVISLTDNVLVDEAIRIQGSAAKTSVFNSYGGTVSVTAREALEVSSNVYMMKLVFRMMGVEYKPNMMIPTDLTVFDKLGKTYEEFGLGSSTGIDLPGEQLGVTTPDYESSSIMGSALDLSFGNYYTYTPLQIAQYVSTIANDGKRMALRVVQGIYGNDENGNLGSLEQAIPPKLLNTVNISSEELQLIQNGFYDVVHGSRGTGSTLRESKYVVSGKTGTAETTDPTGKVELENSTFVGYAPSDDPKVTVTVVLPMLTEKNGRVNQQIALEILNAYYDRYEK